MSSTMIGDTNPLGCLGLFAILVAGVVTWAVFTRDSPPDINFTTEQVAVQDELFSRCFEDAVRRGTLTRQQVAYTWRRLRDRSDFNYWVSLRAEWAITCAGLLSP